MRRERCDQADDNQRDFSGQKLRLFVEITASTEKGCCFT